jgi:hypothetical protein
MSAATLTRPTAAVWDAVLVAGGPSAALDVLDGLKPGSNWRHVAIAGLLPEHWAELQASAIAPDVAAANVASFGPGTARHWETERAELVRHKRHKIQTESTTGRGLPQGQAGHLAGALIRLDQTYRHLQAGGWRTLSATLPDLPVFDQWKPTDARQKGNRDDRGQWIPTLDEQGRPVPVKYEAPPAFPDGGGLLLPNVPERRWRLICDRQGLPFPDPATVAAGFWAWALQTPELQLLIGEGPKKALAAISAGWAAVGVPGVTMGWRRVDDTGRRRLIAALQALSCPGRRWLIAFDAEARPDTAAKVGAAAGALAQTLRAAGGRPLIARLPLLSGTTKTGLDDLLAAGGLEALDRALANTGPRPVLPRLRRPDRIAPAGRWLGDACPIPSPDVAPLVLVRAPMGCGKTQAAAAALAPLAAEGCPVLQPSHRKALGQAAAESIGIPWRPRPGTDDRLQGIAACWDSWRPDSAMRITGHGWSGGVMVLDEWMQAAEHLLLSHGTTLGKRRAATLRTAAEQLPQMRQTIALDAQMADWGVRLLERLTGRQALLIASEHQPMAGRPLHCPEGFTTPQAAADAFRIKWAELVDSGQPFLCWTSAQRAGMLNAPQTLATAHRLRRPGDLVEVVDSTTREAAAELAADPDGFAERRTAEAQRLGVSWALYCSPAISSGISFHRWKPAAVIAYSGGRIAPEHAAQALARVRCPEVPAYLFAPERSPGDALRVGSGATDPAQLIAHLRAVANPLLGVLENAGADGAWLEAWAELGAHRNRQNYAYRATLSGLLELEGWELQAPEPDPDDAGDQARLLSEQLGDIATAQQDAEDAAVIAARLLTDQEAAELTKRRQLDPDDAAALQRHKLATAWGIGTAAPSPALLEADRDGLRKRLRLGWLITTPEILDLVPGHDDRRIAALDPEGRPFEPDRLRVALAPRIAFLQLLGTADRPRVLLELLQRFEAGEVIAANNPAIVALHDAATSDRRRLAAAAGVSPGARPTGTLRALLKACGWKLQQVGRGHGSGPLTYRAQRVALPDGVNPEALAAAWLAELQASGDGAVFAPTDKPCRGKTAPLQPPPKPPAARTVWLALIRTPQPHQIARTGPPPPVLSAA